jgi:hypothetical protein
MKKISLAAALFAAFAVTSTSASAQHASNTGFSIQGGSTGVGVHFIKSLSDNLNTRIGFNAFSYSFTESTSDANYDFDMKLRMFDALLDYFPMNGAFRLTGGAVYNGNKILVTATPNVAGTYTFGGNVYSTADVGVINGRTNFKKLAPYLGIGWGNAVAKDKGWGFTTDLGIIFTGSPNTTLSPSGCTAGQVICDQLAADLARENVRVNEESKDLKYYPVIRFGASYKF